MRILVLAALLATGAAGAALAQTGDSAPRDPRVLRQQIEERFAQRVQEQLGLTDEQTTKLRAASREYGGRRQALETRERALRQALSGQLRPGVAADQDSVARLTRDLVELRVSYAETWRDEMGELSRFLTPVQRAQLYVMRDRLLQRVQEIRDQRSGWRRRRQGP